MSKRILVVDDSMTIREMLSSFLQSSDYIVAAARDGDQALEIMKTERFDVIITDLEMPGMDGFGLIRSISELDWDPAIVLLTHHGTKISQSAKELALAYSVNVLGTLNKPIEKGQLFEILSGVVDTRANVESGTETLLTETEFMRGLMTDGLAPAFQPKIDLATKNVAGAEVFARWLTPSGSYLGAGAVIKMAREKGYMDVLTYRMLELAMQQQSKWQKQGQDVTLSINVTSENLRKPDFAEVVSGLADQFDVDPGRIRLEVAEQDLDVDGKIPLEVLSRLHMRGFGLALDDFGTGFASLLRLKTIPFDELVIDRVFISRAHEEDTARIILETAIDLSHKLGLKCTCEGVEDKEHLEIVRELGANYAQGYLFGKPMSADEFLIWLEDFKEGMLEIPGLT